LPTELPPSLEVPEALSEVSEPELDPDPEPEPEPEPDLEPEPELEPAPLVPEGLSEVSEPELDPDPEPEPEPDLEPEPELAPLSTPSWEALEEEPPQPAKTAATIRATYGEVRVNLSRSFPQNEQNISPSTSAKPSHVPGLKHATLRLTASDRPGVRRVGWGRSPPHQEDDAGDGDGYRESDKGHLVSLETSGHCASTRRWAAPPLLEDDRSGTLATTLDAGMSGGPRPPSAS